MPILGTLSAASVSSYGSRGLVFGGSAYYSAVNGKALSVPASSNFAYGTGDFTVEMWIYPQDVSYYRILWAQTGVYNSRAYWYFLLYLDPGARQLVFQMNPGAVVHPTSIPLNAWTHVAVVRRSGVVKLFVNGYGTAGSTITSNLTDTTVPPTLGNYSLYYQSANQGFMGYVTNLRVAKSSYYTTDFAPSRQPFTRTSQGATNVQLLLNHQTSARLLTDSSANGLTVTNTGAVAYNSFTPYAQPYTNPTPVVIVSASVTPSTTTANEGDTITFTIAGSNTTNGTYYWTIEEPAGGSGTLTAADFTPASLSGSFTITGNAGSIPITVVRDLTTEGDESFALYVRSGSITGTIIGNSSIIDITDSSLTPTFTTTPTTINEGTGSSFNVANIGPNGTYYWTILHGTTVAADFTATSGSFTITGNTGGLDNGTGNFLVVPSADRVTEGTQTFQVEVRSGSTSGPVIITSASVNVGDVSVTPSVSYNSTVNEGASLVFSAQNLGPAGNYYWTILHGTSSAADFAATSGTLTTVSLNGFTSWTVDPVWDGTTEAGETFQIEIRDGSTSGPVIVTGAVCTITNVDVTASGSPTSFNEGASTTITASATIFPAGTYYWTILNGTTTNADFTATSGSFSVASNTGSFTVTAATLGGAEAAETFQVQIRKDSTSGAVLATTGTLTINANAT